MIGGDPAALASRPMTVHERLQRAVALFNDRDFFAAHEAFEEIWRDAAEIDAPLGEALIRLATAFHLRLHRGAHRGTVNLLQQALVRLEDMRPVSGGIDTAALYDDVAGYLERLRREPGRATWWERFRLPRLRLVGGA